MYRDYKVDEHLRYFYRAPGRNTFFPNTSDFFLLRPMQHDGLIILSPTPSLQMMKWQTTGRLHTRLPFWCLLDISSVKNKNQSYLLCTIWDICVHSTSFNLQSSIQNIRAKVWQEYRMRPKHTHIYTEYNSLWAEFYINNSEDVAHTYTIQVQIVTGLY